jgi:alanyl-tRNA synthetase
MKADELRELFLKFFEEKGHTRVPSDLLVPQDDPTLLFSSAGMNQFKNEFLGKGRALKRAASCQKCLRTGDIDNVGVTAYHHTFFEMLGNFSFNDYFKKDAQAWAWEFLTEWLKIPAEKLVVSVYTEDDEAYNIWRDDVGVPKKKICRFDSRHNFWPAESPEKGPNGLCGPCAEIFYDWGKGSVPCDNPNCDPSCDCGRFCEVWNLVFQVYNRTGYKQLEPLGYRNIDTGMGFERLLAVVNGVRSNYDTELFTPILNEIAEIARTEYERDSEEGRHMRRIADHIRALCFAIAENIIPDSADERGYILRKLLRRAYRDGRAIGIKDEAFLYRLVAVVGEVFKKPYPEISQRRKNIEHILKEDEEKFARVLDRGELRVQEEIDRIRKAGGKIFPGERAFWLHDTFGFPVDVTVDIVEDSGLKFDQGGFDECLSKAQEASRKGSKFTGEVFKAGPLQEIMRRHQPTRFTDAADAERKFRILEITRDGEFASSLGIGEEGRILLNETPFYAQSGGQIGDSGELHCGDSVFEVTDTQKEEGYYFHVGKVKEGSFKPGDEVRAIVGPRRKDTERNHSATHLLQFALCKVLGPAVEQSGSLVEPERLRFDFTFNRALAPEEMAQVEAIVNERILANDPVSFEETTVDEAKKRGVIALFGEKYGERVRVVDIGGYSMELCGGTHVRRTGDIGLFKILREGSVASGIRRIEALTGHGVLAYLNSAVGTVTELIRKLKCREDGLLKRVDDLIGEIAELKKKASSKAATTKTESAGDMLARAEKIGKSSLVCEGLSDRTMPELRDLADELRAKAGSAAIVLMAKSGDKASLIAAFTKDLVEAGMSAVEVVKKIGPIIGGGGGGRPDLAQSGGKDPGKIDEALTQARALLKAMLSRT